MGRIGRSDHRDLGHHLKTIGVGVSHPQPHIADLFRRPIRTLRPELSVRERTPRFGRDTTR